MTGSTWIHGRRAVLEALDAGVTARIFIAAAREPSPILQEIESKAEAAGIPVQQVPQAEIARRARGGNAQGVAAEVEIPQPISLRQLRDRITDPAFVLVLDQIQDPHNLGALLRSAEAAGVQGVVLPQRRSVTVTAAVMKTSAGAAARVAVAEEVNLARALTQLRREGIWTVGLDAAGKESFFDLDLTMPLALILGSEGSGLRRLTREQCDFVAYLPMCGSVGSLNVSVAGGVAMYETVRQRSRQSDT